MTKRTTNPGSRTAIPKKGAPPSGQTSSSPAARKTATNKPASSGRRAGRAEGRTAAAPATPTLGADQKMTAHAGAKLDQLAEAI